MGVQSHCLGSRSVFCHDICCLGCLPFRPSLGPPSLALKRSSVPRPCSLPLCHASFHPEPALSMYEHSPYHISLGGSSLVHEVSFCFRGTYYRHMCNFSGLTTTPFSYCPSSWNWRQLCHTTPGGTVDMHFICSLVIFLHRPFAF